MGIKDEIIASTVKTAPPAVVSVTSAVAGVSLVDWVLIATLVYTLLQIVHLIVKWVCEKSPKGGT